MISILQSYFIYISFLTPFLFGASSFGSIETNPDFPDAVYQILDDKSGEMRSEIEFYRRGNELRARIKTVRSGHEDAKCNNCPERFDGKKLLGMDLIWGLKWDGSRWSGGSILDVDNGKIYNCRLNSFSKNEVVIRAYIGRPLFGETLTWYSE
ncbi:MAG: DUF2147 domain-containing protein [Saprospirales bacterium]|nr:MAG: DUF2147 domain-containing protein [Saprospirales bacterium]